MDSLCFVILNFRQANLVISNVTSLKKTLPEATFVLVDNDSRDGSYEKLASSLADESKIKVISSRSNSGYAIGNNLGVKEAINSFDPKFIAIMNPDVVIAESKTISAIIEAFRADNDLSICTGLMLDSSRMLNPRSIAWKTLDKLDDCLLNLPYFSSRISLKKYRAFRIHENGLIYVDVVPGSFFVARTDYFKKMGMFDENTFLYCEERILGIKAKRLRLKVALVPSVYFVHDHPKEEKSLASTMKSYFHLISSRFYYNKTYNSWPKWIVLPPFIVSAGLGYLLTALSWVVKRTVNCFKRILKKGKSQ